MSLEYNLQFFAAEGQGGEKTEPATEKKLTDARKEGQRNSCKNFNIGKKHKNNKNAIRYKHYKREKVIA